MNDRVYAYSDILKPSYLILAKEGELHLILRRNDKFRLRGNAQVKLSQKKLELSLDRSVRAIVEDGNTRRSISLVDATLQSTLVR